VETTLLHSKTLIATEATSVFPVMEAFYTIQGEGVHQGRAAFFIRLAGCDVGCHWCDVKDSWDASSHPLIPVTDLVEQALEHPARLAVITGGEPLMHDLDELTSKLHEAGFTSHIETSGTYPMSGQFDWICLSPKKFRDPDPAIYPLADELKVIVYNRSDLLWAERQASMVSPKCALILQPEWSKAEKVMPLMVEYVKQNPRWRISLQSHKYMEIP
jgi:organic radical activating enzyme